MFESCLGTRIRAVWTGDISRWGALCPASYQEVLQIERSQVARADFKSPAKTPEALNIPGFDFHPLRGKPKRYSVHVNGPWCITFEWEGENALRLDLENYH